MLLENQTPVSFKAPQMVRNTQSLWHTGSSWPNGRCKEPLYSLGTILSREAKMEDLSAHAPRRLTEFPSTLHFKLQEKIEILLQTF